MEHKMETVSNNLANVNTVGFKEDQPSFREVLSNVQRIAPESLEERFLSHEYLDDYVGMDKSAVVVDEVGKNFEPGRMRSTGNNLDFAISNEGFFTISTPQGERFTRAGNFQLDSTGRIVTNDGYPVLGRNGIITIKEGAIDVNESGILSVDGIITDSSVWYVSVIRTNCRNWDRDFLRLSTAMICRLLQMKSNSDRVCWKIQM